MIAMMPDKVAQAGEKKTAHSTLRTRNAVFWGNTAVVNSNRVGLDSDEIF